MATSAAANTTARRPRKTAPKAAPRKTTARKAPVRRTAASKINIPLLASIGTAIVGAGLAAVGYAFMKHRQDDGTTSTDTVDRRHDADWRTGPLREWSEAYQTSDEELRDTAPVK
jgi:uncharacterized protein HemX